ncbi:hypothetical protein HYZ41_02745, partial [archaeon]|nr:hypothetical protein [archaeon]
MIHLSYEQDKEDFCKEFGYQVGVDFMTMKPVYRISKDGMTNNTKINIADKDDNGIYNEYLVAETISEAVDL